MTMKSIALTAALAALTLGGCTIKPMLVHEPTTFITQTEVTAKDIQTAVMKAAHGKGWQVLAVKPDHVLLCYPQQSNPRYDTVHAVVRVNYTTESYHIVHVSEHGLELKDCAGYPDKKCIHRNYNRWIANLDMQIRHHIQLIGH